MSGPVRLLLAAAVGFAALAAHTLSKLDLKLHHCCNQQRDGLADVEPGIARVHEHIAQLLDELRADRQRRISVGGSPISEIPCVSYDRRMQLGVALRDLAAQFAADQLTP